ncbi:PHD finger-containing protein 1-like isoform X2 [Wolffia australiana]
MVKGTVCLKCGVSGFKELLVFCKSCKTNAEHCYCLDVLHDLTEDDIQWLCHQCCGKVPDAKVDSCDSMVLKKGERKQFINPSKSKNKVSIILKEGMNETIQKSLDLSAAMSVNDRSKPQNKDLPDFRPMVEESKQRDVEKNHKTINIYSDTDACHASHFSPISRTCPELTYQEDTSRATESVDEKSSPRDAENYVFYSKIEKKPEISGHSLENRNPDLSRAHPYMVKKSRNGSQNEENLSGCSSPRAAKYSDSPVNSQESDLYHDDDSPHSTSGPDLRYQQETSENNAYQQQRVLSRSPSQCFSPRPAWRGFFWVRDVEYGPIVGYIALKVSQKVDDAVKKFPRNIFFQILPKVDVYPPSFKICPPDSSKVAIYFLPGDSRGKALLHKLLDELIVERRALRANLDIADLLVFSSFILPTESLKIGDAYYLWGVFRETPRASASSRG